MALSKLSLQIPSDRTSCAAWLQAQTPPIVADALSLCEAAYLAVGREVSEGEAVKLQKQQALSLKKAQDTFEKEKEALRSQYEEQLRSLERRHDELRGHKETLLEERDKLAATHAQHMQSLHKCISERDADILEARSSTQEMVRRATEEQKRLLLQERQQHEDFLKGEYEKIQDIRLKEIEALNHELDRKKGSEALARQEVFQEMSKKVAEVEAHKLAEAAWLKNELAQRDAALSEVRAAKDAATEDFSRRMEVIVSEHRDLVLRLSGATVKGQAGEFQVASIFSRLQLGAWQDDHTNPSEGYADATWTWHPHNAAPLSCLVEIKRVNILNSVKDITKFEKDLNVAVQSDRVNAGLFISLNARYPGIPALHLETKFGVPVCYVSRTEDDPLPTDCLVEMGFRALAEAWPLICRQRGTGVQLSVNAAALVLDEQLKACEKLSTNITNLGRLSMSLKREAEALNKLRESMISGIDRVRLAHPSLVLETPEVSEEVVVPEAPVDPWSSAVALQLLEAIKQYKVARKRYPKDLSDVDVSAEGKSFADKTDNAVLLAVGILKKGQKRSASHAALAERGEEDLVGDSRPSTD